MKEEKQEVSFGSKLEIGPGPHYNSTNSDSPIEEIKLYRSMHSQSCYVWSAQHGWLSLQVLYKLSSQNTYLVQYGDMGLPVLKNLQKGSAVVGLRELMDASVPLLLPQLFTDISQGLSSEIFCSRPTLFC